MITVLIKSFGAGIGIGIGILFLRSMIFRRPVKHEEEMINDIYHKLRHSTLQERAIPNQRLVTAFGIDNAFTTTDIPYHNIFKRDIISQLQTSQSEWIDLAEAARWHIRSACLEIPPGDTKTETEIDEETYPLVRFIQIYVFRMVIEKFFPGVERPCSSDAALATEKINSLWIKSKSKTQTHTEQAGTRSEKEELFKVLRRIFGLSEEAEIEGRENPLNIILPTFETLWRIVLRCFLILSKRDVNDAQMRAFIAQPCKQTFEDSSTPDGISIRHLVQESLRLYPPTRRIYRHESEPIDIEALQRTPVIWGADALMFRPERWRDLELESETPMAKIRSKAYLPFGKGNLECPAQKSFAPMMIGLLAASLLDGFRDGGVVVRGLEEREGTLSNKRDDGFEKFVLVRRDEERDSDDAQVD